MAGELQVRRGHIRETRKPPRSGLAMGILAISAVPVAALVWFLLQSEERRRQIVDKIPEGWGRRAALAAGAFILLLGLARLVLPLLHGAAGVLQAWLQTLQAHPGPVRVVLYPLEFFVWLLWFLMQALFAIDAFLIVAVGLIGILLAARIVLKDLLPGFMPNLESYFFPVE